MFASLVALGGLGASQAAAEEGYFSTATTLTVTPTVVEVGGAVMMTAVVEGGLENPQGTIQFDNNTQASSGEIKSTPIGSPVTLSPVPGSGRASEATLTTTSFAAGSYEITAAYTCAGMSCFELEESVSSPVLLRVGATPVYNTQMMLAAEPGQIVTGEPEEFKVKVWETEGTTVPAGTVTFDDNGTLMGTAQLDSKGVASLTHMGFIAGSNEIKASYEGDKIDHSASAAIVLDAPEEAHSLQTATKVTATPSPAIAGQAVTITASVTQVGTTLAPPAGAEVTFTANGVYLGEAPLNASGEATIVQGGWLTGSYDIKASYVGDITDLPSSGDFTLAVQPQPTAPPPPPPPPPPSPPPPPPPSTIAPTSVHPNVSGPVLAGSTVTLSGTLLDTETGKPVQGEQLSLTLAGQACLTGATDASGDAGCQVTAAGPLGPTTSQASFAGDSSYEPSNDSEPALLYGPARGSGSFVIGDEDAATGTAVTFWGAQWWKLNALSGGPAPSAFKGFALTPAVPRCGVPWTTGPGNSPPPPVGPLPSYMAVIVTGSSSKSGSTIQGSTDHVVIVRTNAGYMPDPGHPGTGAVVATVC